MEEKLLEIRNLNVEYHSGSNVFHAVNGISFDLGRRETIGLVGETGAGKTTTALAIMGLLSERTSRVNSGEIIFKGEDILTRSREEMRELRGAKISMIMISHDLGVVVKTCDKVAIMYAGEIVEIGPVEDIYGGGRHHPYTEGLFGAIPDIYTKVDRLNAIDGLMPDPANLPQGCKFAPRCRHCMEICKTRAPETWARGEHRISCHLYGKEGA